MAREEGCLPPLPNVQPLLPAVVVAPLFANLEEGLVKTQQWAPQVSQEGEELVQLPLPPATHQPRHQIVHCEPAFDFSWQLWLLCPQT